MNERLRMFWMVKAENRPDTTVWHSSRQSAKREAERLAEQHPGVKFFVLQCIGAAFVQKPMVWIEAEDYPF